MPKFNFDTLQDFNRNMIFHKHKFDKNIIII